MEPIKESIKYTYDTLVNYCNDNGIALAKDYSNLKKLGSRFYVESYCSAEDCNNIANKQFRYLLENGSYCDTCTKLSRKTKLKAVAESAAEKRKETNLERYNVENLMYSQEKKDKLKETCLARYNVDNVMKLQENIGKIKETCIEKYGEEHVMRVSEIKMKKLKTEAENAKK